MSWLTTRQYISELMAYINFAQAEEFFNVEKQPASFADRIFCIQLDEMLPNADGFGDVADRFFPTQRLRISVIYEVFNGSQDAYDASIDKNMKIIQTLINPNNRADDVRMIGFVDMRTKLFNDGKDWLIVDNIFDLQVQITWPPTTDDHDAIAPVDENTGTTTIDES